MTIPILSSWSVRAKLVGAVTAIGAFLSVVVGIQPALNAIHDLQPFATKGMLVAQADATNQSVDALRWDQLFYAIDALEFQLGQKQFQIIQLEDLIKESPDQIKEDRMTSLKKEVTLGEKRLEFMRCQYDNRGRLRPTNC